MKFTNQMVVETLGGLQKCRFLKEARLRPKLLFALNRNITELERAYATYAATIKTLCEYHKVPYGKIEQGVAESAEFANDIASLLAEEIDVPIRKVPEEELLSLPSMTMAEFSAITFMVEE